jgi:cytosine/adenosine deaminase-related metal-dependent hydrolase
MTICSAASIVTDNSARALCLGDNYGLAEGRPANLLILDAENDYEAVRRQARVLTSIRHGKVILQREVEHIRYPAYGAALRVARLSVIPFQAVCVTDARPGVGSWKTDRAKRR